MLAFLQVLLVVVHVTASWVLLSRLATNETGMQVQLSTCRLQKLYLSGMLVLEIFCSVVHPLVLGARLPFLPLLVTSVYCSCGICSCWASWACSWVHVRPPQVNVSKSL